MKKNNFCGIVAVIIACIISYYIGYQTGLNKNVDYLIYKNWIDMNSNSSIDN